MNERLLHLYAGPTWHAEGFIVGSRDALLALRDTIDRALEGEGDHGEATTGNENSVYTRDGECYEVIVIRQDTPGNEPPWERMALPYTDEDGRNNVHKDDIWPGEIYDNWKGPYTYEEGPGLEGG